MPENQNNGDKIQNSWLPRNQNMKNKNLTSPKKKGKFFAVKNQGNFKSPQKQVLNPDEIQSMFKNKLPSKKRRPEQYRKDENPRLPKKRRLLARKNAQNHKIPYPIQKKPARARKRKNLGMKQKLMTLNHKFFNEILDKTTSEQPDLAGNIRKLLKIPDILPKPNDHEQLKKFSDFSCIEISIPQPG